ncbi:MAG TPA: ATP-binding protein [Bryobacteraceae bacterium]|nr:ATP-binding protein [Bryobacteraceae bacterium]
MSAIRMQYLLLALLVMATSMVASGAEQNGNIFSTAQAVLNLTRQTAGEGLPVKLRGVVMSNNGPKGLFLRDATAGIYVSTTEGAQFVEGDLVVIQGKTGKGGFLPIVRATTVTRSGRGQLPAPRAITYDDLSKPHTGGSYVEATATVRSLTKTRDRWVVILHANGVRFPLEVHSPESLGKPEPGDIIRVTGALGCEFNATGQWVAPKLHVQSFRSVRIVHAASSDEARLPLTRLAEFLRHDPNSPNRERARVQGTVTCLRPEGLMFIQQGVDGVLAQAAAIPDVSIGDLVEITGFPTFDRYSPRLGDVQIKRLGRGERIAPIAISMDEARSGRFDAQLVEMTGTLIAAERNLAAGKRIGRINLALSDGSQIFNVELTQDKPFTAAEPGSRIKVTGVCRMMPVPPFVLRQHTFSLLLRDAADVEILAAPPWWEGQRIKNLLPTLGVVILVTAAWVLVLRRKVKRQTAIIREQLHLETAMEERYRDLIENATDLVFTVDVHGLLLSANKAAQHTFGLADDDVGGTPVERFVTQDDKLVFSDVLALLIGGERTVLRHVRLIASEARDECIIEMNCRVRHVDGHPTFVEIIGRDVTQQNREREALEQARLAAEAASRAKSEFLANMSHEIRTPMNGILGMTELALQGPLQPDQRGHLEIARTSAEALVAILNDVLDYSNLDVGRLELKQSPFEILPLVGSCLDLVAQPAAAKGLRLVCDVDPTLPSQCLGDAARLRQVLVNLVGNASKFTDSGEIVLRVDRMDALDGGMKARFQVRDTGIGIPKELQHRIFELFSQADGSFSRQHGGAGLGLAMSARLVKMMGGKLVVESTPGVGSTFEFTIPMAALEPGPMIAGDLYADKTARIAVTNRSVEEALGRILRHAGMRIVDDEPASVVIADEHTPDIQSPVVYLHRTGTQQAEDLSRAIVVREPVLAPALISAVETACSDAASLLALREASHAAEPLDCRPTPGLVLLAEDNKVNQMLAVRTLEKGGYTVVVANNGREAVELMRAMNPSLVLMDIQMPEVDGFQATAQIRKWSSVPVIAMTAHALTGDRERCLDRGMTDYISKPVRPPVLLEMVERYMPARSTIA